MEKQILITPKISVIIPLYNKREFIGQTIKSVLDQSFCDFELLIVDDGSTDDSARIVTAIKDSRIRLIEKTNGGVSSARNRGLEEAIGEWIFFLDADDFIYPNALDILIKCSLLNINSNLILANFCAVKNGVSKIQCKYNKIGKLNDTLKLFWEKKIYVRIGSFIVKKQLVFDNECFDEKLSLYEDLELLLKLMSDNHILYTNEVILDYIRDNSQLSHVKNDKFKDFASKIDLENEVGFSMKIKSEFYCRSILKYFFKGRFLDTFFLINKNKKFMFNSLINFFLRLKY